MKNSVLLLIAIVAVTLFVGAALQINTAIVEKILVTGAGGFSVAALTQIIKNWIEKTLRYKAGWLGIAISLLVSIIATALYFSSAGWSTIPFVIYSILVWAVANGFFKIANPTT
jgi:phage-related holin